MILQEDFKRLVIEKLREKGMTRTELATRMGVAKQVVTNYLNDASSNPNDNLKEQFFRALGCRPRLHLEEIEEIALEKVS